MKQETIKKICELAGRKVVTKTFDEKSLDCIFLDEKRTVNCQSFYKENPLERKSILLDAMFNINKDDSIDYCIECVRTNDGRKNVFCVELKKDNEPYDIYNVCENEDNPIQALEDAIVWIIEQGKV